MAAKKAKAVDDKKYCAIIFIGGGSTWHYGATPEQAAKQAAKLCQRDWGNYYEFNKGSVIKANIIDMTNRSGWVADYQGIFDTATNEKIPTHSVIDITV